MSTVTRAEFVKILNNVFGLTTSSGKVFLDTKDHWAKNAIDIAVTNGVCKGKSDTEFNPDAPITREEAAVMIANYKKLTNNNGYNEINKFSDSKDVSDWAKDGVEGSIEQGYMNGYTDNTFKPKGKITRAEAVSTLSRAGKVDDKLDSQTNQEKANEVISKINDIGDIIAKSVVEYFQNEENMEIIKKLKEHNINMEYVNKLISKRNARHLRFAHHFYNECP